MAYTECLGLFVFQSVSLGYPARTRGPPGPVRINEHQAVLYTGDIRIKNQVLQNQCSQEDHFSNTARQPTNTVQRSHMFNSLREACHHQRSWRKDLCNTTRSNIPLYRRRRWANKHEGNAYYILNTSSKALLLSWFKHIKESIKELLLQHHIFSFNV